MKKSVLLGLLSLTVCLFTACSSDNDEGGEPTPPTVSDKKISSMKTVWGGTGSNGSLATLSYDKQERVIYAKEVFTEKGETTISNTNYSYSNTSIEVRSNNSNGYSHSVIYTLDNNKRISKAVLTYNNHAETCEYIYDKNGQLVGITANGDNVISTFTLSWHNGNINTVIYSEKDIRNGKTTKTIDNYTYTNYPIKNLISVGVVEIPDYLDYILFMQGSFGAYPKNPVQSMKSSTDNSVYTLSYEIDSDGNITKITDSKNRSYTLTWK